MKNFDLSKSNILQNTHLFLVNILQNTHLFLVNSHQAKNEIVSVRSAYHF